ncbi:MAG: J domain-containing protein [Gemmataceae bacterium]
MTDPYEVLGLPADSDDETIRRRYLELVKEFPPALHPERFAAVRAAYDSLRDHKTRVKLRLFEPAHADSLEKIVEEIRCQSSRPRVSLETLLSLVRKG